MYKAMTIAGSDSGAGAGIQADLKTFSAFGVYGTSAITAITAQNTLGVTAIHEVPPEIVRAQIEAVLGDIGANAIKTGMLANTTIIRTVAECLRRYKVHNLVVDPVMAAKSGDALLRSDAICALRDEILPLALVLTPNLPEAEIIVGCRLDGKAAIRQAAREIHKMGSAWVLVKGGHREGDAVDLLFDGKEYQEYRSPRIATRHTHGTGCTFAAAIAAGLAKGVAVGQAVSTAKGYLIEAIRQAQPIGSGHGPVHHFHQLWARGCWQTDYSV